MAESPWRITPAALGDENRILAVHQEAFVAGYINTREPELGASQAALTVFVQGEFAKRRIRAWRAAIIDNPDGVRVARAASGLIVGVGEVLPGPLPGEGLVSALYVDPAYHRQRIGSLILANLAEGYEKLALHVTRWASAVNFYEFHEFRITDEVVPLPEPPLAYGIRLEQIAMERQS